MVRRQGARAARARFVDWGLLRRGAQPLFLTVVEVGVHRRATASTISCRWRSARRLMRAASRSAVAASRAGAGHRRTKGRAVRCQPRHPVRGSACSKRWNGRKRRRCDAAGCGRRQTSLFRSYRGTGDLRVVAGSSEQSNTSIVLRRPADREAVPAARAGGQSRLRDRHATSPSSGGFRECPVRPAPSNTRSPAKNRRPSRMMQQLVESQADGWRHATEELSRFYDQVDGRTRRAEPLPNVRGHDCGQAAAGRRRADGRLPRNRAHARPPHRRDASGAGERCAAMRLLRRSHSRSRGPRGGRDAEATAQVRRRSEALQDALDQSRSCGPEVGRDCRRLLRGRGPSSISGADAPARSNSPLRRSACTATITSARCCGPREIFTSWTSRASRRGRLPNAARSSLR